MSARKEPVKSAPLEPVAAPNPYSTREAAKRGNFTSINADEEDEDYVDPFWVDFSSLPEVDGTAWLYPDVLARECVVQIFGTSEAGKSLTILGLVCDLLQDGRRVVWLDGEMTARRMRTRMRGLGIEPSEYRRQFHYTNEHSVFTVERLQELLIQLDRIKPDVIVIDSLPVAMAAAGLDEDRNNDVNGYFARLVHVLAHDYRAAVVVIDQVGKDHSSRESRGASSKSYQFDLRFELRCLARFDKSKVGRVQLTSRKNRDGEPAPELQFAIGGDGNGSIVFEPVEPKTTASLQPEPSHQQKVATALQEARQPMSTGELSQVTGLSKSTILRDLEALIDDGTVSPVGDNRNRRYQLA